MAQSNSGAASGTPLTTRVAAVVSQHGVLVPVYDADSRVHYVPESEVDNYLRAGYSRTETHVEDAAAEIGGLFDNAHSAVEAFVKDAAVRGAIDREADQALATAQFAMAQLTDGFARLMTAMHTRYPLAEAEPVVITTEDGTQLRVDPTQADGKSHAQHVTIVPNDDPRQWTEDQRRAAGLISTVPPHLADPNNPFAYRTPDDTPPGELSGDPTTDYPRFAQVSAERLAKARQQAALPSEDQEP